MPTYNLFISHSWSYTNAYEKLIELLDYQVAGRRDFTYKDFSIPKNDPVITGGSNAELEEAIYRQMKLCHVILVLAGVYASCSDWIAKEIEIANRWFTSPKPLLAIKPWANKRVSLVVSNNADDIVGWNGRSVVNGIIDLVGTW